MGFSKMDSGEYGIRQSGTNSSDPTGLCTNEFFPHKMKNEENWFSRPKEKSLEKRIA
jgi:hypothetical protein